jgi:putative ABC transport system substrate-binding protein
MEELMRTSFFIAAIAGLVLILGVSPREVCAEKKIGIFMFSEETRYVEAIHGIKDRLTAAGFGETKARYFEENAGGNKARAAELVKKIAGQNLDLIVSLGTSMTVALSREIKDVPIVFSVVYDPVDAGIANNWKSSGNNTTGSSQIIPMSKELDSLKKFAPVKRLAVLYTPGEKNSETQVKNLQAIQDTYQIKVVPVRLAKKEEIAQLLPEVLRSVDALYITGSNLVNSQVGQIVAMASKSKVITISHLEDLIIKGVLFGVCANSYAEGVIAGDKAVKILKGAKPASLPIDKTTKIDILLNMTTVTNGGFIVPPEFMASVTRKIN